MSNTFQDNYDLFAATDNFLTRPRIKVARERRFYPSESSVMLYDKYGDKVVHGGCLRASYFRCSGEFEGVPHNARSQFIFMQGKIIEEALVNVWKEMGIWVDNNLKFVDEKNNISGEIDVILREPDGQLFGVEVKTAYKYMAEKELFGNYKQKGFPKMNQLLQTLIYCYEFKDILPYFRMAYFMRDSVKRKTFKIELHKEDELHFPKVDGEIIKTFTIEDILARYKDLQHYLDTKTIPPNDYELQYSNAKIEDYYSKGKVSKTKYKAWKDGKLKYKEYVGDWNCSYCSFCSNCWE